nr:putative ring finger protein c16g5.03 [Quercus suber]
MACNERNCPTPEAAEEDDDDFKTTGATSRAPTGSRSSSSPDVCTICLQPITERAVAGPCNHLAFDFICLASWLQDHDTCPLCKAPVATVQYDWRSPTDYQTFHVRHVGGKTNASPTSRMRSSLQDTRVINVVETTSVAAADPSLGFRRQIYRDRLYAMHIGENSLSRFADFLPHDFAASTELQSRARTFLRRELLVFAFLDRDPAMRISGRQYLVEYIVAVLKIHHPKGADGQAQELLVQSLGRANATHLLHELTSWLRSPFTRLMDWDEVIQYNPHHSSNNKHA